MRTYIVVLVLGILQATISAAGEKLRYAYSDPAEETLEIVLEDGGFTVNEKQRGIAGLAEVVRHNLKTWTFTILCKEAQNLEHTIAILNSLEARYKLELVSGDTSVLVKCSSKGDTNSAVTIDVAESGFLLNGKSINTDSILKSIREGSERKYSVRLDPNSLGGRASAAKVIQLFHVLNTDQFSGRSLYIYNVVIGGK